MATAARPRGVAAWRSGRLRRARAIDSPRKDRLREAPRRSRAAPHTSTGPRARRGALTHYTPLEAETRPEGPRLERRDEIIGQRVRERKSMVVAIAEWQPSEAREEARGGQRDRAQAHLVAVQGAHLAAQV